MILEKKYLCEGDQNSTSPCGKKAKERVKILHRLKRAEPTHYPKHSQYPWMHKFNCQCALLIQDSRFKHRLFHKYTNILGVGDTCILKMAADIARILTSY